MNAPSASDHAELEQRIARLLQDQQAGRYPGEPRVSGLRRVFGGNARQAWAFDAEWPGGARDSLQRTRLPCILLSQVPGRHVDSDASSEYRILAAMTGHGLRAPAAVALDTDGQVTGAPAVVLERIEGGADPVAFLNPADPADSIRLTRELAAVTADLHGFDWRGAGLSMPETDGPLSQIEHWEARYRESRVSPHPPLTYLFGWLKDHMRTPPRLSLVHGDLRPGNFLYQAGSITALLDWEMAHIGDPAEDIAWIYRDLWSPEKFLSLEDFLELYEARSGAAMERSRVTYYRIFSEVKFATLSIAASASFTAGKAVNMRYADRASKVPAAIAQCFALIASQDWNDHHAAA